MKMDRSGWIGVWVAAAAIVPATAAAQVPPGAVTDAAPAAPTPAGPQPAGQPGTTSAGRRSYDAAYFAQYSPQSALQIVERIPGFAIEEIDPTLRGFGQAAGNVVVNGQRPSSKNDTTQTILARIPATRVLRVEVGPGDLFGTEFTGKPQVLNVVLTVAGGAATTLEGTVRRDYAGRVYPEGSVSTLLRRGPSTFNASLTIDNEVTQEEGYDTVVRRADGVRTEYRRKVNRIADPNAALAAAWAYDGGANRTAHLNVRSATDRLLLEQTNLVTPLAGAIRDDFLTQDYRTDTVELGGDVTRPLASGGLKLIGLATRRYRDYRDVSLLRPRGAAPGGFVQLLDDTLAETLGRIVWTRTGWNGWTVELGGEGVVNELRSRVDLFGLDAAGARTRIDLPIDDATVREVRGEGFVNAGRALSPKSRVDASLTYERSRLTVRGDATAQRTLAFLKPKLVFDWRPGGGWRTQATLQRTVAQLQFEDFISSAELASERVNGGNAELRPQRAWEALLVVEHPILRDGIVRVEAGYNRVSQVQDRVPTPEGFDAPGNLGSGRTYILRSRIEAPLGTLGVPGGRLILYGSLVSTAVRDPYTGRDRPYSSNSLFLGEATFRQDRRDFAWGVTLTGNSGSTVYRRDETDRRYASVPYVVAFAEWRPAPQTTITVTLDNASGVPAFRTRDFYLPDRTSPVRVAREFRERNRHIVPALTFKKTFG